MRNGILQNNEGISPVLGFILMLAIGVTILSTVQLTFVPVWNTQEELNHLMLMQDDFKVLKSNIDSGILGGTTLSSPLIMGFKYSPKMMVYNPKDEAYASLEVKKDAWVEVRYNEVFPEGMTDDTSIKNVSTGMMIYALQGAQNYNSFIYENGLIRRSGSNFTTSSQTVLANGTIYLPSVKALDYGSLSGVEKKTINIYPTSQQKNSVIGKNVWLILHTDPNYVEWWAKTLENEGATVRKKDPNGLVIANISSNLVIKMGEAYISSASKASPAHSPPSRLVRVSSQTAVLPVDGVTDLIVEVQDEYNNPVPNVLVSFSRNPTKVPGNSYPYGELLQSSAVSGSDGRASVQLKTNGAGFYYVDAIIPEYNTTFAYSASSQGTVMELDYSPKIFPGNETFNVTATLKNSLGGPASDPIQVTFETGNGSITSPVNTSGGIADTTLNVSGATGIKITNIQVKNTTSNTTNITWNTYNNITVTAKSGYVFNSRIIPTTIITSGCVFYGTSPNNYFPTPACDNNSAPSHLVPLAGLSPNTAYYFIVNSSRTGGSNVYSTEYMFVTDAGDEIIDDTPPGNATGLAVESRGGLYITWKWTDPIDADLNYVNVYINGTLISPPVTKGVQQFNATYLMPNSTHTISLETVDTSGNKNPYLQNNTNKTLSWYTFLTNNVNTSGEVIEFYKAQSDIDSGAAALFNKTSSGVTGATENYTNVTGNTTNFGSISNWGNLQIAGAFANFTEGGMTSGGGNTSYYATSSPTGHTNVIGAPNNVWDSVDRTRITGSSFASGGSGTITKVVLKYYYSITNYGGDVPTVGYTLNSVDTIAKTEIGNVAYNYPNPTYIIDITSALGTWTWADVQSLALWLNVVKVGAASTIANVDAFEVNVTTSAATTYTLNITTYTDPVPVNANYYIEIRHQIDTFETGYNVLVFNGTGWANKGSLTSNTWTVFNQSLSSQEYNSGNVSVRYTDLNPSGTSRGNLSIDYQRIHGYTPGIAGGWYLDVTTNTTGIPNALSQVLQVRYNVSMNEDNFTLNIKNSSTSLWDVKATLNQTTMNLLNITLQSDYLFPDGAFSLGSVGDLQKYYLLVRYNGTNSSKPGKLYLDYQRVNSS